MSWPIVSVAIEAEGDIVAVRQRARQLAELLGFERQDQTRVATAASEIARNAFSYGGGGRAEFLLEGVPTPQAFVIRIRDRGPGIADLDTILEGRYRSPTGMGLGLIGARRLMDRFAITSAPGAGTQVELTQLLPRQAARLTQKSLAALAARMPRTAPGDPLVALREQNLELLHNLEELRRRQAEADQLNRELADTNRGVVALYAELDGQAEQLRQASELKSRFLSNMSHEFRTPLNSILALSRLLLERIDGDLGAEQERQVGYIRRSAEGLLELVNDLLDLAKVEAGKVELRPAPMRVGDLFGALRGALRPLQANPAVELVFDPPHGVPELFTDEGKLAQILRNLISNALKFTEAGEVRVSVAYDPGTQSVAFAVRDTGIGIAPEDQAHIFDEFTQVDTRLQRGVKGTGLGLPLSRQLAGLLGGDIQLESVPAHGSVFRLTLPVAIGRPPAEAPAGAPRRVLMIDDDETFRYVMRQIVGADDRYEIAEAIHGLEGLAQARALPPDIILLDLQMPELDGFATLGELRVDPLIRDIPVIVATSLPVNDELRSRLPQGIAILSKQDLSRERVFALLRGATQMKAEP